jgi:hypothetical protein
LIPDSVTAGWKDQGGLCERSVILGRVQLRRSPARHQLVKGGLLRPITFGRLSRMHCSQSRDVAPVVDARQKRYGEFDPAWRRRDDSRGRAVHICVAQSKLFEEEEADGAEGSTFLER